MRKFEVAKGFEAKGVILPTRGTKGSAGYDFRVLTKDGKTETIFPFDKKLFHTGVKACMADDEVLQLYVRSSVGIKKGCTLANGTGIIDSSYYSNPTNDGEIMVVLVNNTNHLVTIDNNERIVQGIFMKYFIVDDDNVITERIGGLGSTNAA